ncbi:hypothetical protein [Staphylococcus warneri]|uniref:hypothetical protein n=1 Tax=Staphylococcus warneri TaxID=1292 RepID=UPI001A90C598|nr:hypothetical protein [Staphylococcus warneri]MBO0377050.1 hypothetical protein [Staphylococcus warneri]
MTSHNMTNQKVEIHKLRKRTTISVLVVAILVIVSNYFENKNHLLFMTTMTIVITLLIGTLIVCGRYLWKANHFLKEYGKENAEITRSDMIADVLMVSSLTIVCGTNIAVTIITNTQSLTEIL